jgi:16S rRNA processing protein RimM
LTSPVPAFLVVGRIGRPHGVLGEVEVDVWTDFPERFQPAGTLFVGHPDDSAPRPVVVASARPHHDRLLVRFDVIEDRTAAAELTGLYVMVPTAAAMPLEADAYYHHQLLGLTVELPDGTELGTVTEVIETGSADVLVVSGPRGDVLVPMIGSVIAQVDLAAGRILVTPIPGLLDD